MFTSPLALSVGHATDPILKSGVTVVLPDRPAVASVYVAGGGPGTRETDLLAPEATVEAIDAIVLSGGSAFGLAAGDGAMRWLAAQGRGFAVGPARVPIVPSAILFDLLNGGEKDGIPGANPYPGLAEAACGAAARRFPLGSVGAGTGATTADLKGGFGAALARVEGGGTVLALAAANALGTATLGDTPHFRAAVFEEGAEFGGLGLPPAIPADAAALRIKSARPREATTLAVVATDFALSKPEARRLAVAASAGLALALFPAFTPLDGDIVFALSTSERPVEGDRTQMMIRLCAAAQAALARAVARAVYEAEAAAGDRLPVWRDRARSGS